MAAKKSWREKVAGIDAHHRFFVSLGAAAAAFALLPGSLTWFVRCLGAWDAYSVVSLTLAWITIVHADPAEVARTAKLEDSGRTAIFFSVLLAAGVSMVSVGGLLGTAKNLGGAALTAHVIFAAFTLIASWSLVHTTFTLRYAHMFYNLNEKNERGGGVDFPEEENPDFLDFAYFSFVIGMTCQVSDVDITGRSIRRVALLHGILSFGFNTAIVAMGVNLASSLFTK